MKNRTNLIILTIGILLSACFKPDEVPVYEYNGKENMTIAAFQALHILDIGPATLITDSLCYATVGKNNIVISGIVTSTDKYGSSYKEIFLQDETGGISIRTSNTSYYTKYPVGQRIFIETKDLYLGNYVSGTRTGFYQIGLYGNGSMQYLSQGIENMHVFRSGVPVKLPEPKTITKQSDIITGIGGDYHKLVQLKNCYFVLADGTTKYFEVPEGSTLTTISRNVEFYGGSGSVEARISQYCNYGDSILPMGALNITGLLTMFGTTPQLIICSIDDVEIAPTAKILKNFDMKTDPFTQGWTIKQIAGSTPWTYQNSMVQIEAPAGNETKCMFVSPKFNFAGEKDIALCFTYRLSADANGNNAKLFYTTDGTQWLPLVFVPETGGAKEAVLKLNDNIAANPNLQIAFQYETTTVFPAWRIMDIKINANMPM